ncbi:MAG: acetate kinase [Brevinemataceae bacterium]
MKILVLNAGSSSLKYQLLNTSDQSVIAKGVVEKIGLGMSIMGYTNGTHPKVELEIPFQNHEEALEKVFESLVKGEYAVLSGLDDLNAIGHRVVHGGETYSKPVLVTDGVLQELDKLCDLAPLHNPANIMGIRACKKIVPNIPQVVVFDTAFHQTMPPVSYLYPIPYEYYNKYGVRRYGFHGTSYAYVVPKAAALLKKNVEDVNLIVCHIGNGASITAIRGGKSLDTSMGFTPLDGLMMGTRCGSIDPAITLFLMEKESLSLSQASDLMNKQSGLKGISEVSSDMRDVEQAAAQGNQKAELAIDMLVHSIRKTIGSYFFELNGQVDAIVFTAGMGEFDTNLRSKVTANLNSLGIEIDTEKNKNNRSKYEDISTPSAKIRTLVVPTNEELMIALQTEQLL